MQGNMKGADFSHFIGRELGTVVIMKELGRGTKGVVFVGYQKSLRRQVAVKILPSVLEKNEDVRARFRDEAEIIAVLSHPNIIPIFDMGENEEFYYQVMHLVKGADLSVTIKNRYKHPVATKRVLPLDRTIDIMVQVLDGMQYAHEEGIVHQDIKPANILLEERTGRPLLADFGIARAAQIEYKARGMIVGTPIYISPEQAAAGETDARSDVYSLGVVLFEMLCGVLPLRYERVREMLIRKIKMPDSFFTQRPADSSFLIDEGMEEIILKATATEPDGRFAACRDFRDALAEYRDTLPFERRR